MTLHVMRGSQNWKSREGAGAAPWGVLGLMVVVHNFSYGLLTPVLGYVMSCLGCFLGLRCTTRARGPAGCFSCPLAAAGGRICRSRGSLGHAFRRHARVQHP